MSLNLNTGSYFIGLYDYNLLNFKNDLCLYSHYYSDGNDWNCDYDQLGSLHQDLLQLTVI